MLFSYFTDFVVSFRWISFSYFTDFISFRWISFSYFTDFVSFRWISFSYFTDFVGFCFRFVSFLFVSQFTGTRIFRYLQYSYFGNDQYLLVLQILENSVRYWDTSIYQYLYQYCRYWKILVIPVLCTILLIPVSRPAASCLSTFWNNITKLCLFSLLGSLKWKESSG
jgi:hypothetical protein